MKNVVISGSTSQPDVIQKWVAYWKAENDHHLLDYPQKIGAENFNQDYAKVFADFYQNVQQTDILFVANEQKNGINGYIGAGVFAEIAYAVAHNIVDGTSIDIILANSPSEKIHGYSEVSLWIALGWIRIMT